MKFARVIGTVVATRKYEGLEGIKFLVVQPLDRDLNPKGRPVVAADATAQAAPGELVFMVASREGAQALPEVFVPVDLAITGIVDEVDVERGPRRQQPTAVWHHLSEVSSQEVGANPCGRPSGQAQDLPLQQDIETTPSGDN